jgi:hypothetical protein
MKINCLKCIYYFVTWDIKNQRGCKFHGFKSQKMPSRVVFEASGEPCTGFNLKK